MNVFVKSFPFKRLPIARKPLQRLLSTANTSHAPPKEDTREFQLDNGVRAVLSPSSSSSTSCGLFLDLGSRHETEATNGLTRLLIGSLLANQRLREDLKRAGVHVKAEVTRDRSHVVFRCLKEKTNDVTALLARMLSAGAEEMTEADLEVARSHVLREISSADKNGEKIVLNNLHKMAFQRTGLGLSDLGLSHVVQSATLSDVREWFQSHVKGPRVVVSVAGSDADLKSFENLSKNYDKVAIPELPVARYTGSDIRVRDDALPVAHIALCLEGPERESQDFLSLALCHELVGQWDQSFGGGADLSSYLATCSAVDHVTLAFKSLLLGYRETSLFGVYMVCERMKQEDAVHHVTLEWKRFATEITDNELTRAKNALCTRRAREREGALGACLGAGEDVLSYGRHVSLEEFEARVLGLSAKRVRESAEEYVWDKCPVVSAFGPIEQLEDYEVLRGKFYWLRY